MFNYRGHSKWTPHRWGRKNGHLKLMTGHGEVGGITGAHICVGSSPFHVSLLKGIMHPLAKMNAALFMCFSSVIPSVKWVVYTNKRALSFHWILALTCAKHYVRVTPLNKQLTAPGACPRANIPLSSEKLLCIMSRWFRRQWQSLKLQIKRICHASIS